MLDAAPTPRRDLLERTAFAPHITPALAIELAGEEAAAELEPLADRGLLRKVANDRGTIYEAHSLVRRGMQTLLRKRRGDSEAQQIALATAAALQRHGAYDDAFALLIERDVERAAPVLEILAERYARSGQAALLTRALAQLPASLTGRDPWLCFWAGQALLGVDEESARGWFARSYAGFEQANDRSSMRLAAACVVTAFGLEYGDIRSMDEWMERHSRAGGDEAVPFGCTHEASLCLGVMCAAIARGAFPPGFDTEALVARLSVLIDDPSAWLTPDQPIEAARLLIDHRCIFDTREQAQAAVIATRAHAESETTGGLQRGRYWISAAQAYLEDGMHGPAAEFLVRARRLVDETGSRRLAFELGMADVNFAMKRNDLDAAAARLSELEAIAIGAPPRSAPSTRDSPHACSSSRVAQRKDCDGRRMRSRRQRLPAIRAATRARSRSNASTRSRRIGATRTRFRSTTRLRRDRGKATRHRTCAQRRLRYLAEGGRDVELLRRAFAHAANSGFVNMLAPGTRRDRTPMRACTGERHRARISCVA